MYRQHVLRMLKGLKARVKPTSDGLTSDREFATVDWTIGPPHIWKGRIFKAESEQAARDAAHAFGYTVLSREVGVEEWEVTE